VNYLPSMKLTQSILDKSAISYRRVLPFKIYIVQSSSSRANWLTTRICLLSLSRPITFHWITFSRIRWFVFPKLSTPGRQGFRRSSFIGSWLKLLCSINCLSNNLSNQFVFYAADVHSVAAAGKYDEPYLTFFVPIAACSPSLSLAQPLIQRVLQNNCYLSTGWPRVSTFWL